MKHDILIYGSSACALRLAQNLAEHGVQVYLAAEKPDSVLHDGIQLLEGARIVQCKGFAGAFELKLNQNGRSMIQKVAAVAIATDECRSSNILDCGLASAPNILDIAAVEEQLARDPEQGHLAVADRIVLLSGLHQESHPKVFARMLGACLKLQKSSATRTFLITGNLKVAGKGLEAACHEAKTAGTVFIKCTERLPELQTLPDGRIRVDYWDELTRDDCRLEADCVVVDERLGPDPELADLSRILGLEQDGLGFAQSDNVRRINNLTNRRGIFMAGSARGVLSSEEIESDADQAALEVMAFFDDADREELPQVQIDPGRCARCLTCYRVCPHRAVNIGTEMVVVSQACQSCGICAASCPARAIDVEGLGDLHTLNGLVPQDLEADIENIYNPRIVIFGCARSADSARQLAAIGGSIIPGKVQFVRVPCGGAVSLQFMLAAFESGADGVLVCTCHEDNCRSREGSGQARKRAAAALELLTTSEIENDRLQISTLAANMGREFYRIVGEFHQKIKSLGPWFH